MKCGILTLTNCNLIFFPLNLQLLYRSVYCILTIFNQASPNGNPLHILATIFKISTPKEITPGPTQFILNFSQLHPTRNGKENFRNLCAALEFKCNFLFPAIFIESGGKIAIKREHFLHFGENVTEQNFLSPLLKRIRRIKRS